MDDALFRNARQLGLSDSQARKLSNQYFTLPGDVVAEVQSDGLSDQLEAMRQAAEKAAEATRQHEIATGDSDG